MIRRFLFAVFVTIVASLALPGRVFWSYLFRSGTTGPNVPLAVLGLAILAVSVPLLFVILRWRRRQLRSFRSTNQPTWLNFRIDGSIRASFFPPP